MKRAIVLVLAAAFICVTTAKAQKQVEYEAKNEVAVSYGVLANSDWMDLFENIFETMFTVGTYTNKMKHKYGPVSVEYFRNLNKWLAVGAVAVYAGYDRDVMYKASGSSVYVKDGEYKSHNVTLMPAIKAQWLRRNHFGMYSKLAVGACVEFDKRTSIQNGTKKDVYGRFDFQLSPIGLEAGGERVRAFAEFGVGEQGVALAGVRYKF